MCEVMTGDVGTGDATGIRSSLSLDKDSRRFLNSFISRIEGLYAIVITDGDGVPVVKVMTEQTPPSVVKSSFLATVSLAIDQAGKVGIGKNKRIICMFNNYQVVHFNKCPLMVSLIASSSANTGMLLNLDAELSPLTDELKVAVDGI